jgi:hypothetical protein
MYGMNLACTARGEDEEGVQPHHTTTTPPQQNTSTQPQYLPLSSSGQIKRQILGQIIYF